MSKSTVGNALLKNLQETMEIGQFMQSSLGPHASDKLITRRGGDMLVTSDGRTLMDELPLNEDGTSPVHQMIRSLSRGQDDTCGDGTTSVVVLCGAMCDRSLSLIERQMFAVESQRIVGLTASCAMNRIVRYMIEGYKLACEFAIDFVKKSLVLASDASDQTERDASVSQQQRWREELVQCASASLQSKQVGYARQYLAKLCVDAVLKVADLSRRDCNLHLIKMEYLEGGTIGKDDDEDDDDGDSDSSVGVAKQTKLYDGIVLMNRAFTHENMNARVENARIAVLSCALEIPRPKTKHHVNIRTTEQYDSLRSVEKKYHDDVLDHLEECGVNVVICQWGIDHEVNHGLMSRNMVSVRWVGGGDIERLAMATGAQICPRVQELTTQMLGFAKSVSYELFDDIVSSGSSVSLTSSASSCVFIEGCRNARACSVVVRAPSAIQCEDTIRSLWDAIRNVKNCIEEGGLVMGGGSVEVELHLQLLRLAQLVENDATESDHNGSSHEIDDQLATFSNERLSHIRRAELRHLVASAISSWAHSLLVIPRTLASNAGLSSLDIVNQIIAKHQATEDPAHRFYGIHLTKATMVENSNDNLLLCADMRQTDVFESVRVKRSALSLATELTCMLLKIDQIITADL